MGQLKVIKLITDEEVIGIIQDGTELDDTNDGYTTDNLIFISSPLKITSEYSKEHKVHALYLSDWAPSIGDETLPIDKSNILTLGNPTKKLEEYYCELILARHLMMSEAEGDEANDLKLSSTKSKKNDISDKLNELLRKTYFSDDDLQ